MECIPSQRTSADTTGALYERLHKHLEDFEAVWEAIAEVDDPEMYDLFRFSDVSLRNVRRWFWDGKESKKVIQLYASPHLAELMKQFDSEGNRDNDSNTDDDDNGTDNDEGSDDGTRDSNMGSAVNVRVINSIPLIDDELDDAD